MRRLLLDANLSAHNASFLKRTFGFDAVALNSLGLSWMPDPDVLEYARRHNRILVTLDRGFGKLYGMLPRGEVGIIVLRHDEQSLDRVDEQLGRLFDDPEFANTPFERRLVIVDANKIRIRE